MATDSEAYREYADAAIALATSVEVADRLGTDPTYPADRGPAADAGREQMRRDDLARFRAARDAFDATLAAPQEPEPTLRAGSGDVW